MVDEDDVTLPEFKRLLRLARAARELHAEQPGRHRVWHRLTVGGSVCPVCYDEVERLSEQTTDRDDDAG